MTDYRKLGIFLSFRRLASVRSLLIAVALCMAGQAGAAAPDLTAGGVPTDGDQWNLGPTGMAGWCYRDSQATANAASFLSGAWRADRRRPVSWPSVM